MSVFSEVIVFLNELGVYDVILPFLLVFTIVFAVLEKTRVFGTEMVSGVETPKKNLNSMVAFVVAFIVIASSQLVSIIQASMGRIVLLIMVLISFLILIGTFFSEKEEVILQGGWRLFFMILVFIGVALVFLDSIPTDSGASWLEAGWFYLITRFSDRAVSGIVLILVLILFMVYITHNPKAKKEPEKK